MAKKTGKLPGSNLSGFTLVELMVAMVAGILVMLVIIQMFSGTKQSYRLQEGLTRVQEDGRIAVELVAKEVRKAGFRVPVWNEPEAGYFPLTGGSVEGSGNGNDTLQIMYQDSIDCTGILNSAIDRETSEPAALYKRLTFSVDGNQNLRGSCEYGATPAQLVAQYTNQNIIGDVESFQVIYGIDTDFPPDFSINSWTTANNITPQNSVCLQSQNLCESSNLLNSMSDGIPLAVKIALLIASPEAATMEQDQQTFQVLNHTVSVAEAHKLRKLYTSTISIRNLTL